MFSVNDSYLLKEIIQSHPWDEVSGVHIICIILFSSFAKFVTLSALIKVCFLDATSLTKSTEA